MKRQISILVVDDEPAICKLLVQYLQRHGHSVRTAESGEAALPLLESEQFDLMIFDLKLPGMNGVELCRKALEIQPAAKVFSMTGYASVFEMADCHSAGFDRYFTKPLELKELLEAVEGVAGTGE